MPQPFAFGRDFWDTSHRFETSWLLSPYALFFCRAFFGLYTFTVLIFIQGWYCGHSLLGGCAAARDEFSYFTVLAYWGIFFYFLVSSIHTITYAVTGRPLIDRFPRPLQAFHSALYTTIAVYPFLVTVVDWAVLYSGSGYPTPFDAWRNVSQHATNSFFGLFEIFVTRTDVPPLVHMLWLIVLLALHLSLAYITKATKGFYVYNFLNPSWKGSGTTAGYIFGIAVASLILFWVAWGLISLRLWVTEEKLGRKGKFSRKDGAWRGPTEDLEMLPSQK